MMTSQADSNKKEESQTDHEAETGTEKKGSRESKEEHLRLTSSSKGKSEWVKLREARDMLHIALKRFIR